jgi:hypothetical protein
MSFLTSSDLFFNLRGTGWSSSSRQSTPPPSVTSALAKALLKFTVLDSDASHYLLHFISPCIVKTGGGSIFDARIPFWPHMLLLATYVGGMWVCLRSVFTYSSATKAVMLIGADKSSSASQPPTCLRSSAGHVWRHLSRISGASSGPALATRFYRVSGPVRLNWRAPGTARRGHWEISCKMRDSSSSWVSALFWRTHFKVRPGFPCEGDSVGCGP